jgi:hypothetical protein
MRLSADRNKIFEVCFIFVKTIKMQNARVGRQFECQNSVGVSGFIGPGKWDTISYQAGFWKMECTRKYKI